MKKYRKGFASDELTNILSSMRIKFQKDGNIWVILESHPFHQLNTKSATR